MGKLSYAEMAKEAEATGYGTAPLTIGEYDAVVSGASYKKSDKGNDTYKVEFTVTSGKSKGRKAWKNVTLSDNNRSFFFQQMNTLGLDSAFFADIADEDDFEAEVCAELVELESPVVLDAGPPREYKNNSYSDIKRISPATGVARAVAADDEEPETPAPRRRSRKDPDEEAAAPPRRRRVATAPDPADPDDDEGYEKEEEAATPPAARRRRASSATRPDLPPGV